MGVTFKIENSIITFALEEINTVEQATSAFAKAFAAIEDEISLPVIVDARFSQRHRDLKEVSIFAESLLLYKKRINGKCALVINEKRPSSMELEKRLAAYSLREKIQFGLFLDIESAREWVTQP